LPIYGKRFLKKDYPRIERKEKEKISEYPDFLEWFTLHFNKLITLLSPPFHDLSVKIHLEKSDPNYFGKKIRRFNMPIPMIVFGTGALIVTLGYVISRFEGKKSEPRFLYRCPKCQIKIRYTQTYAGKPGKCPRCKTNWILPDRQEPLDISQTRFVGKRK
jgi:DNA-directed RNA polymerase subunit RPC12/RpoP